MAAFASLIENGTVGRVGCSNWPTWRVEQARRAARDWQGFTALQLMHSYLQPRPGVPVSWQPARFGWVTDQTLDYVDARQLVSLRKPERRRRPRAGCTEALRWLPARSRRPLTEGSE